MYNRIPALYEELVIAALAAVPTGVKHEQPFSISLGQNSSPQCNTFIDPISKRLEVRHAYEGMVLATISLDGGLVTYHGPAFTEESLAEHLRELLAYQKGLLQVQVDNTIAA